MDASAATGTSNDTTTTAEEMTSPTEDLEVKQGGRFSFAEIYAYIKDGRYTSDFTKSDKP